MLIICIIVCRKERRRSSSSTWSWPATPGSSSRPAVSPTWAGSALTWTSIWSPGSGKLVPFKSPGPYRGFSLSFTEPRRGFPWENWTVKKSYTVPISKFLQLSDEKFLFPYSFYFLLCTGTQFLHKPHDAQARVRAGCPAGGLCVGPAADPLWPGLALAVRQLPAQRGQEHAQQAGQPIKELCAQRFHAIFVPIFWDICIWILGHFLVCSGTLYCTNAGTAVVFELRWLYENF